MSIELLDYSPEKLPDVLRTAEECNGFTQAQLAELVPTPWSDRFWRIFHQLDLRKFAETSERVELARPPGIDQLHRQIFLILREKGYPSFLAYYDKKLQGLRKTIVAFPSMSLPFNQPEQQIFAEAVFGCGRFLLEPKETTE